ncbi:hypothetical protein C2G38_2077231 [Gigaspora rosea]|uniref:Uncharacterized protein n=1 Tax=Gigaspora rosea TaxID=44941 RepID=A0A397VRS6_9GLOM|nr:hypothetical protein C2G38_2077231 [Gigaspora rosea]
MITYNAHLILMHLMRSLFFGQMKSYRLCCTVIRIIIILYMPFYSMLYVYEAQLFVN